MVVVQPPANALGAATSVVSTASAKKSLRKMSPPLDYDPEAQGCNTFMRLFKATEVRNLRASGHVDCPAPAYLHAPLPRCTDVRPRGGLEGGGARETRHIQARRRRLGRARQKSWTTCGSPLQGLNLGR